MESHWILDHQQKIWMGETKNGFLHKMRHQSSRIRKNQFDQEEENQRSTGRPKSAKTIIIFVPHNNNRFDNWGG